MTTETSVAAGAPVVADAAVTAGAAVSPETTVTPEASGASDIDRALEAIFMVADEPQSLVSLATALGRPVAVVRQGVERLVEDYDGLAPGGVRRGFELREVAGGWRLYVRGEHDPLVRDFVMTQNPSRLSQAALETLAVIAYKQPISRGAVASIRAVNVDSVVRTLLSRGLITEVSTQAETGAILYGTTDLLLTQLGLNSLDELPKISPLLADGSEGFDDLQGVR
ncbi:SMC-Scp complex subunit ScpB [Herbiconiux sp. CPCC 205716]|uniref:SMC-Scp complex subunit ScpB n=1 Tax=Herbiconiux gentiana TaxID=2970912 RepID=A0ABT2GBQ9_9MICO|nr:SMC-Scp complex subunit ScpB [Herbiconiux gentiana]MCS5713650.1 SMC-Scp complex subunit ScpB [Herbiconiux gentiana]